MTQLQVIKKEPMMAIGCLTLAGLIVSSDYFGWVNWNNNHAYIAAMVFLWNCTLRITKRE